ncbi:MAG: tyrosine-type recombinase/integrase [Clostridia bacterium]|nr:tyrosine-type recombinase/integrase [Clostridia bacterium]
MKNQNLSYYEQRDLDNMHKIGNYVSKLPEYCYDYIIGIESTTSSLTRLNYAMDLHVFFEYLSQYVIKKPIMQITLDDLEDLEARDIENYLSHLSFYEIDEKVVKNSERGKARKLASVRSFFKYLFNHDLLKADVASKVKTPKLHTKQIIRLESDEVERLLDAVDRPVTFSERQKNYNLNTKTRDNAIVTLFLGTGIRISELVGLNIDDFDFNQNAFKVTRKGGNQSILYFSDEVKNALKEWLEKRETLDLPPEERAMFISLQNKRICVRAVENLVKKFAREGAPLKKISPHKLRSTFGTNLYKETKDIYIVADVLGHKDVNTTKKHYAAINEDMRKAVADIIKIRKDDDDR